MKAKSKIICTTWEKKKKKKGKKKKGIRGHPDLNRGPLDLQSNALPLSYTPFHITIRGVDENNAADYIYDLQFDGFCCPTLRLYVA